MGSAVGQTGATYKGYLSDEWRNAGQKARALALLIHEACREQSPNEHVEGCPALGDTTIDGRFNLVKVAEAIIEQRMLKVSLASHLQVLKGNGR
jgi:hypothetical protein